jgi:hypothetical protein
MDANEARKIEQEITDFITHHFDVEGKNFYDKLQSLSVASKVRDRVKRSLIDDLHELRKLRNKVAHEEGCRSFETTSRAPRHQAAAA